MTTGTFEVGETVVGTMINAGTGPANANSPRITFRVAQANHKEGYTILPIEYIVRVHTTDNQWEKLILLLQ